VNDRMPKALAVYLLTVIAAAVAGIWGIFNGYEDAVVVGGGILLGVFTILTLCVLAWLVFEAIRSLLSR
jgi:hypothetical protein